MSARGDARKRQAERCEVCTHTQLPCMGLHASGRIVTPQADAYDEHADILAELAETQAALHAATNDVVRLAAELHTAHGQVDRVREVAQEWHRRVDAAREHGNPPPMSATGHAARNILRALDGGAS